MKRNLIINSTIIALLSIILFSCGTKERPMETIAPSITIQGQAQGTTYTITTVGDSINYQPGIDSLLNSFDQDVSLWIDNSLISRLNKFQREDTVFSFYDSTKVFSVLFDLSQEIYEITDGAFDPTVYPLVEAWGFGLKNKESMSQEKVDSLLYYVGFEPFRIDMNEVEQNYIYQHTDIRIGRAGTRLDFNAIAQGYSVDLIGDYLQMQGVENYMVELGGELKCRGHNAYGNAWRIAVDKPVDNEAEREFQAVITVEDRAVATSGNYRKFYTEEGKIFSHTIDPRTGYPVDHSLLSATVLANECSTADAYATAFMVMGVQETAQFLAAHPELGLDVYLLYHDGEKIEAVISEGLRKKIEEIKE